jgi:hypothetical protein
MGTRRPNRRSSIYLGNDGLWHGWVTVGVKADGSADRRHRKGRTEAEVTRKVRGTGEPAGDRLRRQTRSRPDAGRMDG